MNGAESLARTLLAGGVDTCFANPGTSEMHFVAALDRVAGIRCVLELFEGAATGAADGYARMAGRPAATLLHLGPGLANGLANLHNAYRARTPMINIVGDHATYHRKYDAPLTSDVAGTARPYSHWLRTSADAMSVARDAADAVIAARTAPGSIATLILPADTAWGQSNGPVAVPASPSAQAADSAAIDTAIELCRKGARTGLVLGGHALYGNALTTAGRIAAKCGVRLLCSYSVARLERGEGRPPIEPIPYPIDQALSFLKEFDALVLVSTAAPVAFFAYPGKPSVLAADGCRIHTAVEPHQDVAAALDAMAEGLNARHQPPTSAVYKVASSGGAFGSVSIGQSIAAMLPEGAIVVDESVTNGAAILQATATARAHDLLKNVGGSIGHALPAAVGAALAAPGRKVVALSGDGSAMYTLQALWSQVRENLNVVNIVFANRSYAVLHRELTNVGACAAGPRALSMLDIGNPTLDWCSLAAGMGMRATRALDMASFNRAIAEAMGTDSPRLIEVVQ